MSLFSIPVRYSGPRVVPPARTIQSSAMAIQSSAMATQTSQTLQPNPPIPDHYKPALQAHIQEGVADLTRKWLQVLPSPPSPILSFLPSSCPPGFSPPDQACRLSRGERSVPSGFIPVQANMGSTPTT